MKSCAEIGEVASYAYFFKEAKGGGYVSIHLLSQRSWNYQNEQKSV